MMCGCLLLVVECCVVLAGREASLPAAYALRARETSFTAAVSTEAGSSPGLNRISQRGTVNFSTRRDSFVDSPLASPSDSGSPLRSSRVSRLASARQRMESSVFRSLGHLSLGADNDSRPGTPTSNSRRSLLSHKSRDGFGLSPSGMFR